MRTILLVAAAVFSAACAPIDTDPMTTILELEVGAYRFHAVASGPEDGELVLLPHGFPQTSYSLRSQRRAVAAASYRAVAIDQRGYSPGARPVEVEAYAMPRRTDEMPPVLAEIRRIAPDFSLAAFAERQPYKDAGDLDGLLTDLRLAGL